MSNPTNKEKRIATKLCLKWSDQCRRPRVRPPNTHRCLLSNAFAQTMADYRMELAKVAKKGLGIDSQGDYLINQIAKAIENYGEDHE